MSAGIGCSTCKTWIPVQTELANTGLSTVGPRDQFSFSVNYFGTVQLQPIPADMRLLFSIGMPNFVLPNLDSVNHCTSKEISMEIKRYLLVQWLTESRFGKRKFGIPFEKT